MVAFCRSCCAIWPKVADFSNKPLNNHSPQREWLLISRCGMNNTMLNKSRPSRRSALILGTSTALFLSTASHLSLAGDTQPVIVELFTSQGCSSCPPADKLLGELASQPNVIPLTFNVDYWDYLGWRDTLGSHKYTKRQQQYAANRGTRQVYTPQMVINGHLDVVGSRRNKVLAAVNSEQTAKARVPMTISETGDEITIKVADSPSNRLTQKATVWVLVTSAKVSIPIERGENRGKKITYYNVVRQMVPAGMWDGKAIEITLPKDGLDMEQGRDCVALLQQGHVGKIIGAVRMSAKKI